MKAGSLYNSKNTLIIRLLTPKGMNYQQTYAASNPFDSLIEGMFREETVEEVVEIVRGEVQKKSRVYLLVNNRAGGNAPLIAQKIARRFIGQV